LLDHKHAVTALSTGEIYTYDANGNMITRVEGGLTYTQTFDAENRLVSVTVNSQTTQFVYDGDGNLVKKIKPDGSRTLYVGGIYEVDKNSGGTVTGTKTYYPVAGAMRINSTLYYVLKDHLGSASVVTTANGQIVANSEQRYYPFGEARLAASGILTDKLFTGQREMAGLGIYHYGARFYSPKLGRFLSADTIVPGYANPQNLNRFSYVRNNPIKYTDPTGHRIIIDNDKNGRPILAPWQPPKKGGGGGGGNNDDGGGNNNNSGGNGLPEPNWGSSLPAPNAALGSGGSNNDPSELIYATYLNSYSHNNIGYFLQGALAAALPPPPQSINWCSWVDCGLSLVSILASGVITAFPEVPVAVGIAFVVDVAVTVVAINRTNDDYDQGKISPFRQRLLNWTAGIGALPIPYVGFGFSIVNGMTTLLGVPN
jgi:RHS repeat-associated protein